MLKFISFGSGSSGNCYYLYTETDALLIDAGVGIRKLKKHFHDYGLKLNSIHNILITHDHADHVKSVGSLSQSLNVPVYSTKSIHSGIYKNWGVRKKSQPPINTCYKKENLLKLVSSWLLLLWCLMIVRIV